MEIKLRVGLFSIGMLGAIFAPPLVPMVAMVLLALRYAAWEIVFLALFVDLLWSPASPLSFPFFTIASLLLVWGLEPMRREFMVADRI